MGVDDEIVDGGSPRGDPVTKGPRREEETHDEQNDGVSRGCESDVDGGGRRFGGVAASGDYGRP